MTKRKLNSEDCDLEMINLSSKKIRTNLKSEIAGTVKESIVLLNCASANSYDLVVQSVCSSDQVNEASMSNHGLSADELTVRCYESALNFYLGEKIFDSNFYYKQILLKINRKAGYKNRSSIRLLFNIQLKGEILKKHSILKSNLTIGKSTRFFYRIKNKLSMNKLKWHILDVKIKNLLYSHMVCIRVNESDRVVFADENLKETEYLEYLGATFEQAVEQETNNMINIKWNLFYYLKDNNNIFFKN